MVSFAGVGYAMLVLSLIVSIYYNVIMSYSLIYIGASIRGIWEPEGLPWSYCGKNVFSQQMRLDLLTKSPIFSPRIFLRSSHSITASHELPND